MKKFLSYFLGIFSFISCKSKETGLHMPSTLPEDIEIVWHSGGGMLPQSEGIKISLSESYKEYWYNKAENKLPFSCSKEELEKLYALFLKQRLTSIKGKNEGIVHDRGGTSIQLSFEKSHINIANSGSTFIVGEEYERFSSCEKAILDLAKRKTAVYEQTISFEIDPEFLHEGTNFSLSIDDAGFSHYTGSGKAMPSSCQLYQGKHFLVAYFIRKSVQTGKEERYDFFDIIEISQSSKFIRVYFSNQHLNVEVK